MYVRIVLLVFTTTVTGFPTIADLNGLISQTQGNFMNFLEKTSNNMEEALTTSYNKAVKFKNTVNNYMEEQQQKFSAGVDSYVEKVKDQGRQFADSLTYIPTQDVASNMQNPDAVLSVPARIVRNGYPCETHTVVSNGYILNLHRIPHSRMSRKSSSRTVLLQHGLFASSADWIMNGPEKALAYVLADAGYDVWMSNIRGNKYSKEHAEWKTNSKAFWNFSWHDVAKHDIPTIIDYILRLKGSDTEIVYMGHSMGTTILFAMLTLRPEYNQVLTAGFALAPVAFMTDFKSPMKSMAPLASNVAHMEMLYGAHEFMPKESLLGKMAGSCNIDYIDNTLCKGFLFQICGENEAQYNETLLPVFLSGIGSGTSWKTVVHFAQLIEAKDKFQQFDYGGNNDRVYGIATPPEYDLNQITLPIKLFWSQNDLLSSEQDVQKLKERLPPTTEEYLVPDPKFNHLDYLWAIDAPILLNDEILKSLNKAFGGFN